MKRLSYFLICLSFTFQYCTGQNTPKKEFYSKEFNWKITIPENFIPVSGAERDSMDRKGAAAIEKTVEAKIENNTKMIFTFKSDKFNYFEANYQPFDTAIDGDHLESCINVSNVMYETIETQMPGVKIDTTRSVEKIDNLEFLTFKSKITYPNKLVLTSLMYSRVFGKQEFNVNIIFMNEAKGLLMIDAWRNSKFSKSK